MSHAPESNPSPSSRPDDTRPAFGAGAFEDLPAPTELPPAIEARQAEPILSTAARSIADESVASNAEAPMPAEPSEARPAEPALASAATTGATIELPPPSPAEPLRAPSIVQEPAPVESPEVEPPRVRAAPPPPLPRPNVHEVEAVPVTQFDAPAPTIDVEARRAPPPPPPHPPEPAFRTESRPPPPVVESRTEASGAGSSATPNAGSDSAHAFAASAATATQATSTSTAPHAAPHTAPPSASVAGSPSRIWSMFCHLFLFLAIPTLFLGGLITFLVWQLAGRKDALVTDQGREALNFQINIAVLTALLAISCLGSPLIPVVWFVAGVLCILAAVRAYHGESYRYPFIVRLVRA